MHDEFDEDNCETSREDNPEYNREQEDSISKSQLKREAHALLDLGKKLVQLDKSSLAKIPLPDNLLDAINSAKKIRQHGALKRQLQFIGKLMRKTDAGPIQAAYEALTDHYRTDIKQLHLVEDWRNRLLTEGDSALGELLNQHPNADRQHLRQLMRSAKKESELNKPPRAARELFQYLKQFLAS